MSAGEARCPECGRVVDPGTQQFCPSCSYPLVLDLPAGPDPPPAPRPESSGTQAREPVGDQPGPANPGTGQHTPEAFSAEQVASNPESAARNRCPACETANDRERVRCGRCGAELGPVVVLETLPAAAAAPTRRLARDRWPAAIAVLTALAVAMLTWWAFAFLGDRTPGSGNDPSVEEPPSRTEPGGEPSLLAVTEVRASSTLPDSGGRSYDPCQLLDGNTSTPWNSAKDDQLARLSFTFAQRADLQAVEVVNGHARSQTIFEQNSSVRRLAIKGDTFSLPAVELTDDRELQRLEEGFGRTAAVVLDIEDIRPGSKFPEVALSEVRFIGVSLGDDQSDVEPVSCR